MGVTAFRSLEHDRCSECGRPGCVSWSATEGSRCHSHSGYVGPLAEAADVAGDLILAEQYRVELAAGGQPEAVAAFMSRHLARWRSNLEGRGMGASNYVHLEDCFVVRVTEAALLVSYDGDEVWLPKSQVADADGYAAGDEGVTVSVTEWIAKQKGIDVE